METMIHESLKSEARNAVSAVASFFKGNNDKDKNYLGGSISQYSKNLVMTFPVLCDNTLSPETASMISKANERTVTTMLQLLFTAMNIEANDGMKVLAQIHKNISTSMDVYDVMDKMDDVAGNLKDLAVRFETVKGSYERESQAITEMMNELKTGKIYNAYPVESLSEQSLNRFNITKGYRGVIVNEATNGKLSDQEKQVIVGKVLGYIEGEIRNNYTMNQGANMVYDYLTGENFQQAVQNIVDTLGINMDVSEAELARIRGEVFEELKKSKDFAELKNTNLKNFEIERNNAVRLVDTDVKKANEMQPTILQVNYSQKKDNGDIELRSFLAGVKSRLISVSSSDIVERLIAKNRTKINFTNFIRATTGEIGFFHDFLFAIDQAKLDSKNAVKKGEAAAVWNCLANRAASNNKNKLKKLGNDASAITILVLSQETVNYMKAIHKFDLEKMNNTKMICDAYNLMGIIIADESIEVIKSYYVGNNGYEQIAYSFLEKENKNSDYKKVINLLGKTNVR